jgi:hypothetical protein
MKTPSFTALGLILLLAASAFSASHSPAPEGRTTGAAREEIRPHFRHDPKGAPSGKGSFVIESDAREGLSG